MDNSGTKQAGGERFPAGTHEQTRRGPVSSPCAKRGVARSMTKLHTLCAQIVKRTGVRGRQGTNDNVYRGHDREHLDPYDFAQASFHEVPVHSGTTVARHDDAHARETQKGSEPPNLELRGSDSLPFFAYRLKLFLPREPRCGWKAATVRLRRTLTAALR